MGERELWEFFREVRAAVAEGNSGSASQPYRPGTFIVTARAGEVELTVKDVTEEDAVLIAGELRARGVRVAVNASQLCPACGHRVPAQSYCMRCRAPLTG